MPQYPYAPFKTDLGTVLTLTAQAAGTLNSSKYTASSAIGVEVRLYVSAQSGSPTVTLNVQGFDVASGQYYTIGTSGALTTAATTMYTLTVYPSVAAGSTPNIGVSTGIPLYYRIEAVVAGTTPSVTATVGGCTLV